ncbi:MAG: hypothetical protein ACQESR_12245 [Planctomycetota bacterium]
MQTVQSERDRRGRSGDPCRCSRTRVAKPGGIRATASLEDAISNYIFQALGFVRVENCPAQAVLPLVGLAADKVIRDRYKTP